MLLFIKIKFPEYKFEAELRLLHNILGTAEDDNFFRKMSTADHETLHDLINVI